MSGNWEVRKGRGVVYVPAAMAPAHLGRNVAVVYPYGSHADLAHAAAIFRAEGYTLKQIRRAGFPA